MLLRTVRTRGINKIIPINSKKKFKIINIDNPKNLYFFETLKNKNKICSKKPNI